MEKTTQTDYGKSSAGYRAFEHNQSRPDNILTMGKMMMGAPFKFKKINKLKTILLDKETFPEIESVTVNEESKGFGYVTITFENVTRRSHIHWYELAVRILPPRIFEEDNLNAFYYQIFKLNNDPVDTLFDHHQLLKL